MNKRWLHLWLSLVVVGYVVLGASLPAGAQTPTATPTTTSTPQTCIEASSATVTQSNDLTFYAAIWAGGTTTVPDRPELTWNKPGFLPGDYYGWVGHITMRSSGNPPELWQYDTSNNWHPANTPGSFQITYHTNYVAISTPFNVPAIQFDVSLCPGSITPTPTLPAAQQTATAVAQQTASAAAQQTATAAADPCGFGGGGGSGGSYATPTMVIDGTPYYVETATPTPGGSGSGGGSGGSWDTPTPCPTPTPDPCSEFGSGGGAGGSWGTTTPTTEGWGSGGGSGGSWDTPTPCPPTPQPPTPTATPGCIQYQDDVTSELQRNIFLFAGTYTFYFVFFGQTYHLDAVIQFELADFSGAPVYRWNIDGPAFNSGEHVRTETIQTVDGYYNFSGLYPEMEGQNVFTIICNAGGTPTPYATYTPTTTVGPLTPTSTSTPTSTPTPTNTSTPTNTPSPTATFLPGTPAPPTAFPQIIDAPAECTICPPTPTLNTSPMPELGIVLPTLASGDVVVSGTVTISITAILAAVQTVQSGITTPVASLSTTTAFFSWQAGQAQATSWAGQMQPALNWLTILNPTHPAYTSVGGPLWALAPILLPVLPIISASLIVAFVRFFIWVGAWILKVIDVIFKLIELIPGE